MTSASAVPASAGPTSPAPLLSLAAHDLRQPLQAISLLTGSLVLEPDAQIRRDIGQRVNAAVAALQTMLETLTMLSQIEATGLPPAEPCDLDAVLRDLAEELSVVAQSRGGSVRARSSGRTMATTPWLLREAVRGLAIYALWLQPATKLWLDARNGAEGCVIAVVSSSPLPETKTQAVFIDLAFTDQGRPGLCVGLGLRLVQHVAAMLNLALLFEPGPKGGTRLVLRPVAVGRT